MRAQSRKLLMQISALNAENACRGGDIPSGSLEYGLEVLAFDPSLELTQWQHLLDNSRFQKLAFPNFGTFPIRARQSLNRYRIASKDC